jgi:hypothetical protein
MLAISYAALDGGDVGGDPPGLVAGEELGRRAASRLLLKIDVRELRYRALPSPSSTT